MNPLSLILRLLAGAALGVFFYGGLWLSVHRLKQARHPIALTLASFWMRMLIVIGGLVWAMKGRWEYLLVCFVGLWIGRLAVSKTLVEERARRKCP